MTPEEMLDLIIVYAPKLRAAGVTQVSLDGASFTLAGEQIADAKVDQTVVDDDDDLNPLDDPRTYGLSSRRKAPSFRGEQ